MFITTKHYSRNQKTDYLDSAKKNRYTFLFSFLILTLFLQSFAPNIFAQAVEHPVKYQRGRPLSSENYSTIQQPTNNLKQRIPVNKKTPVKSATLAIIDTTGKTINVPAEFLTIQEAIDAASDGDTILVSPGIYKETLTIEDKTLTLKGEDKETTTIDGENENELPAIVASGGNVSISGFTIKNGVNGIRIENIESSIIANNIISNNLNIGIHYLNSTGEILDNIISNNQPFNGARGQGIRLENSSFKINDNTIVENADMGIFILESIGLIEKNTISNNDFIAIRIELNSDINIIDNKIERNVEGGLLVKNSKCSIKENVINNNDSRGIEIVNGINLEITENIVNGNGKFSDFEGGIVVFETDTAIIKNNEINNNKIGLIISASFSANISSNNIHENSVAGVQLFSSKNISILNNIITDTSNPDKIDRTGGISIEDTSALIKENSISFNDSGGIKIADVTSIVEIVENSINNNKESGISCSFAPIITGCCNEIINNEVDLKGCTDAILKCPCPGGDPDDKISIQPSSILLTHIGADAQLSAVLESTTGSSLNITDIAEWTTSDINVSSVTPQGIVVSGKNGNATVCAEFGSTQDCIEVTVDTVNAGINQWATSQDSRKLGDVNDIVINPFNTDIIYGGSNTGDVFKSIDSSKNWISKNNGLSGDSIFALGINPSNPDILYAGATQNLYKTTDGGENWVVINSNIFVNALVINNSNPEIIYIGTSSNGILKSIDGGETWTNANNGLPFLNVRQDSLVIDPSNPAILYLALGEDNGNGHGVFKTVNGGKSWQSINTSLPLDVKGLAIDPVITNILYAGTLSEGVFKTINGGNDWFNLENAPHDKNQTIAIDSINHDVIYVGSLSTGVLMSRNGGETWKRINTQLTNRTVRALKTDPLHSTTIYAGTFNGVFSYTHAFENVEAEANPDGISIDINYTFNEDTGIKPLGFNLYRSSSEDGDFDKITTELLPVNSTSFKDTDFLEGSTHVYRMTVVSEEGETLRSFPATAKPLLSLNPDFRIEVVSDKKEAIQGEKVNYAINLLSFDGFDDEVFLTTGGLPDGVTVTFLPSSGVPPLAINLKVTTTESTPTGAFELTITGTAGERIRSDTVTLRVVGQGSRESSITTSINADNVRVEDKIEITGEIIPPQAGEEVTITFILPDGSRNEEKSDTDDKGRYSLIKEIDQSGTWEISSSWSGNNDFMAAASDTIELIVSPVITTIAMFTDANFETIQGDTLTLIGKISPNPGREQIFLEIDNLDGSINFNSFTPLSPDGEFSHQFRVAGGETGAIQISARFNGNKDYVGNSKEISVPIQEPVGMAIIVAGGGNSSTNSLWKATNNLSNYAYSVIKNLGIPDGASPEKRSNRIFYLHPDINNDADGDGVVDTDSLPTAENLQNTIKEAVLELVDLELKENGDNDAIVKMPLTIYMMGPGDKDLFNINENEVITAEDLDSWLDDLFIAILDKLPEGSTKKFPVNIILESPQSGSFLDNLMVEEDGIGDGRTVVTSTDECQLNEVGDCNTGRINITGDGLTSFSGQFLYGIKVGKSITTSWAESNISTREIFDNQRPQIDANGNGTANEKEDEVNGELLFITGNRQREDAEEIELLAAITNNGDKLDEEIDAQTFIVDQRPVIIGVQKNIVLIDTETSLLWAIVEDAENSLKDVSAIVFPPKSSEAESIPLKFSQLNNRFEATFDRFDDEGIYKVLFVARDQLNNVSRTSQTTVSAQKIGSDVDLRGNVFNKDTDELLQFAIVRVINATGKIGTTGRKGNYSIPMLPDRYTVTFIKRGFITHRETITLTASSDPLNVWLEPKRDTIINEKIVDQNNKSDTHLMSQDKDKVSREAE